METYKIIGLGIFVLVIAPRALFAYSISTHQALTQETVSAYETWRGESFDDATAQAMVKGSADEDEGKRPLNHFYDPIHNRGLTELWRELGLESKHWAQDTDAQANYCNFICFSATVGRNDKYFSSPTDYSWDRAVYEYAHGDKTRGLATLGHILHLIQDSTVPAHVRNDQHLSGFDGDPYEQYTASVAPPKPSKITIPRHASLSAYFDEVAAYTNTRYVSKDTLFTKYDLPSLANLSVHDGFAWDKGDGHKVVHVRAWADQKTGKQYNEILIDDENNSVLSSGFKTLSRTAIQNGVGVIDLFFRSVEAEQKTLALEKKNTSAAERDAKALASAGFDTVKKLYGSSLAQSDIDELNGVQTASAAVALAEEQPVVVTLSEEAPVELALANPVPEQPVSHTAVPEVAYTPPAEPAVNIPAPVPTPPTFQSDPIPFAPLIPSQILFSVTPGFGGGGGPSTNSGGSAPVPASAAPASVAAPTPPDITITSPDDETTFGTPSITITGTATAGATIAASGGASGTTVADAAGEWSLILVLPAGTSTVSFVASKDGADSAAISRTLGVVVPPPGVPTVSATACGYSLATGSCTIPATSTTLAWADTNNAESYDVYANGAFVKNVTGTSTPVSLAPNTTTTFKIVALNLLRDAATSTALTIVQIANPVRINEIAWGGTVASANDQWIELRNNTAAALDLSHVVLAAADGAPYIPLAGSISALTGAADSGYYLIERRSQATTVTGDLATAFALLSQSGEEMRLVWFDGTATTTLDATPPVATCTGWCAGRLVHAQGASVQGVPSVWGTESMERTHDDGALASSWQSHDTYNLAAYDVSLDTINGFIYGTPRLSNSAGWPNKGLYCGNSIVGTTTLALPARCVVLLRFISPSAVRYVGVFAGDVGSSTRAVAYSAGKIYHYDIGIDIPNMHSGDHGFVAAWEQRFNHDSDLLDFENYFTGVAAGPPHTNFAVFPFVVQ